MEQSCQPVSFSPDVFPTINSVRFIHTLCFWSFLGIITIDSRATRTEKAPGAHLQKVHHKQQSYTATAWKQPPLGSKASFFHCKTLVSLPHKACPPPARI